MCGAKSVAEVSVLVEGNQAPNESKDSINMEKESVREIGNEDDKASDQGITAHSGTGVWTLCISD